MSGLRSWLTISSSLRDSSQPETVILAGSSNSPAHPVDEHLLREQTARRSVAFLCLTSSKRPRNRMSDRPCNAKDAENGRLWMRTSPSYSRDGACEAGERGVMR